MPSLSSSRVTGITLLSSVGIIDEAAFLTLHPSHLDNTALS